MTATPDEQRYDLFKLCVELADRTSARRAGANTFFVSLNSIVASTSGYLAAVHSSKSTTDTFSLLTLSIVGLILSLTWWALLRYYRRLANAKWQVINDLEVSLAAQPFVAEWKILHPDEPQTETPNKGVAGWLKRNHHREASVVEQIVPLTFGAVYIALGLRIICS